MGSISEKVELLTPEGFYPDIPHVLTVTSIPTASELEYVAAEDFDAVMLDKILPQAVEEKIEFRKLLEIDYQWLLRCLRIINYGPYYTVNAIYCNNCQDTIYGEQQVDLRSVECKPIPADFEPDVIISKDEFLDYKGDVHLNLPTIQDMLNSENDSAFESVRNSKRTELARMCYMIKALGTKTNLTPVETKLMIQSSFTDADYKILKQLVRDKTDFGLRAGGICYCSKCKQQTGRFLALTDDRFFRPTLGDLRKWKHDRSEGKA